MVICSKKLNKKEMKVSFMSKKFVIFLILVIFNNTLFADFKCELYGELKEKNVKLYFRCLGWDKNFKGFVVKKKNIDTGKWDTLTPLPLKPSIDSGKKWAQYGYPGFQKKSNELIKKYKLPLLSKDKYHAFLVKHGGLKSGDRIQQISNFNYTILMGFGLIVNNVLEVKPTFRLYAQIGDQLKFMSERSFLSVDKINLKKDLYDFSFLNKSEVSFKMKKTDKDMAALRGFDVYGIKDHKMQKLTQDNLEQIFFVKNKMMRFDRKIYSEFEKIKLVPMNIFGSQLPEIEIKAGELLNKVPEPKKIIPEVHLSSVKVEKKSHNSYKVITSFTSRNFYPNRVGMCRLKFHHPKTDAVLYKIFIPGLKGNKVKVSLPHKLTFKELDECVIKLHFSMLGDIKFISSPIVLKLPFEKIIVSEYIKNLKAKVVFKDNKRSIFVEWQTKMKKYDDKNYFKISVKEEGDKHFFYRTMAFSNSIDLKFKDYDYGNIGVGIEVVRNDERQKKMISTKICLWKLELPWPLIRKPIKNEHHILLTWDNRQDKHVKGFRIKRILKNNKTVIVSGDKLIPWNVSSYKVTQFSKIVMNKYVIEAINHFGTVGRQANKEVVYTKYDLKKWIKKIGDHPINFKAKVRKGEKRSQLVDLSWDVDPKYKGVYSGFVVFKGVKSNSVYRIGTRALRDNFRTYKVPEKLVGKKIIFRVRMVYNRTEKQIKYDKNSSHGEYAELMVDLSK
ncbi:MAG: hypothetical protein COA79_01405 [Planctomycetota bacterium]|nr:MAG: hypothetical protein COA79_01405 [Planctomycetota bacterium]